MSFSVLAALESEVVMLESQRLQYQRPAGQRWLGGQCRMCVTACQSHRDTRGSSPFSFTWTRWHHWHSRGKGAGSWCQMCPTCWCQQMCRTQRLLFAKNLRQFGFIPPFQQPLCAALPEMCLSLTGSPSPGSRRWIYRQPIIRWLGRCFPPLPPGRVQGVTDTLLPIP